MKRLISEEEQMSLTKAWEDLDGFLGLTNVALNGPDFPEKVNRAVSVFEDFFTNLSLDTQLDNDDMEAFYQTGITDRKGQFPDDDEHALEILQATCTDQATIGWKIDEGVYAVDFPIWAIHLIGSTGHTFNSEFGIVTVEFP